MSAIDVSRAPRGVLAGQQLIVAVAKHGDLAERHYLELKSTLDLSTKRDKEKIAKFILGAANRAPDVAATAFEGYGVLIIGVATGSVLGIPPIEMMEISKVVQQYVGAAGPRWDVVWVPVEGSANQVLIILVEPPRTGQGPFLCRASGESLTDGRIYIRADGETREAKAEEVDLLLVRGMTQVPIEVDFAVEVMGEVALVQLDAATTINEYVALIRADLESAIPTPPRSPSSLGEPYEARANELLGFQSAIAHVSMLAAAMTEPEKRTEGQYRESIDRWEVGFRAAWDEAVPRIVGSALRPAVVKITNRTTTFFHDVEVQLHLAGDVSALDYRSPDYTNERRDLDLPSPPRRWGPSQRMLNTPAFGNMGNYYIPSPHQYIPPSVSYENGGSVTLELDVGELRPRGTYESEHDELVLVVSDESLETIKGTWQLTARDHNEVYSGEITLGVAPVHHLTGAARRILGLDEKNDETRE
ncbi:hypothetical protein E3O06_11760 [Cryobacterium glaciale]|uniref:Schlafen AlbA-2 domain-containing protein n=1 Tax=Cryobacterium glaciale TaxID=1259145 RepID=A0A4R8UTB0_9MICO|nr:RNA-binding domain-containing protein [Cryobacterium glaciale]TFB71515.1 hypothetical protein E3O06_11760 [Cryobacterium glaciale]